MKEKLLGNLANSEEEITYHPDPSSLSLKWIALHFIVTL